ncbi:MAG TPA: PHP domain-containing protein [Candidatus Omnitrophica bacterium]|nr:PHP domain-containing protein [Candidatus Omnitrophota bacterium]
MNKEADLHLHTIYSDGTLTPSELIKAAKEMGLSCIAVTDHDSVDGIEEAAAEADRLKVEMIPGVELSVDYKGREVHVLGYFIDYKEGWFLDMLAELRESRKRRFFEIVDKLKEHDVVLDEVRIARENENSALGRLHIAKEIYREGYTGSVKEAFVRYIGEGKPCYVKKDYLAPADAVSIIKKIGGISVIAHPHLLGDEGIVFDLIKEGIEGIEVYHFEHPKSVEEKYLAIALENGLLVTGGSDCHGQGKGELLLGRKRIPYDLVQGLKDFKNARES